MLDVVLIGAGPYGLSAGAHIRAISGLQSRVFGEPMSFWEHHMPKGMHLRSPWDGSHFSDPQGMLTLDAYITACGNQFKKPIPVERFVGYGKWFQSQAVPDVERRKVSTVLRDRAGFRLEMENGETIFTRRVVVAGGIAHFTYYPDLFKGLPSELVSHSSDHSELGQFSGRRVIVIGAGQSALEGAALLHEAGAHVELIAREPSIRFLVRSNKLHELGLLSRLMYSPADVGPAGVSRLVGAPGMYRHLPRPLHDKWRKRSVRPAGSSWLVPRLHDVTLTTGVTVTSCAVKGQGLALSLSDGTERLADRVLLATGYRMDISRYPFLSQELVEGVKRVDGFPRLSPGFESTAPGLFFIGAPAMWTFGPLMQFVAGADFAARRLARVLQKTGGR
jgi:FAD-dependent urate hydroxylase